VRRFASSTRITTFWTPNCTRRFVERSKRERRGVIFEGWVLCAGRQCPFLTLYDVVYIFMNGSIV
jgi:hypothetical protein